MNSGQPGGLSTRPFPHDGLVSVESRPRVYGREYRDSTFYVNSIHLKAGKPLFYWNVIISERLKVEAFGFSGSFLALALP